MKTNKIIEAIEQEQLKKKVSPFKVGDSVRVHTRVREGDKERIQVFSGIVIALKGRGINENFTVRRISYGEGVERVFPLHSPRIEKVQVEKKGEVRRSKIYYLRGRIGKEATNVKDKGRDRADAGAKGETAEGQPAKTAEAAE